MPKRRRYLDVPRAIARAGIVALYLVSPALAFIDWKFGWNVRVPDVMEHSGLWILYYFIMTLLGVVMIRVPRIASVLAVLESGVNLALNAASIMFWYVARLNEAMSAKGPVAGGSAADSFNLTAFCISLAIIFLCRLMGHIRDDARSAAEGSERPPPTES